MGKRIAIAAIGTMGDVQPFVALSLALQKRGFSVILATSIDFANSSPPTASSSTIWG
jgi:sterol 3beta-glucosyltransferase